MRCPVSESTSPLCAVVLAAAVMVGCSAPGPGPIQYDSDVCDHCHMTISDPAFAAQLVTRSGKVYRFDDPTCLASFVASSSVAPADVHSIWMNDHRRPDTFVRAQDAFFVVSDRIRAPMNGRTAAFTAHTDAASLQSAVGGQLQRWTDILKRASS
jgi:copper chaperone NosL